MAKVVKTNAMRILDQLKVTYLHFQYEGKEENVDGTLVSRKNNRDHTLGHKTLVTKSTTNDLFVFVIPLTKELDLKKAAKAVGQKKIEMLPHKDLLKYTGYIKGGCSPIGMKKKYETVIEMSSEDRKDIIISGGKRGHIIEMSIENLLSVIDGKLADVCK
ncbi:Cys-tRNA(Pro) deacylase [Sediminitomix flava]|uniref:Cys-tRNA(Pro)/Cys-tRNA(Cys) deacylase n=1 Tax=Sediminitomix flava TaxID=379075 RepID=A0A315ZZ87_SEDFL|nr:Cys-tRNA(Pro) deacylase [Sediminitomix flava]PWJ42687.1 Cys-tRNA(Pro)/Cys-tRNA(Cys) deacylase [Sediminitomix flava]